MSVESILRTKFGEDADQLLREIDQVSKEILDLEDDQIKPNELLHFEDELVKFTSKNGQDYLIVKCIYLVKFEYSNAWKTY